jgi:hypothetical protein
VVRPAATSCYGGAVSWNSGYVGLNSYETFGPYYTTSRCNDINFRETSWSDGMWGWVCVKFGSSSANCNYLTDIREVGTGWITIATDVKDGTKFYVFLEEGNGGNPYGYFAF